LKIQEENSDDNGKYVPLHGIGYAKYIFSLLTVEQQQPTFITLTTESASNL